MCVRRLSPFWIGLLLIVLLEGSFYLLSYHFSLPYIDHIDESDYYLAGQEWRGLFDSKGYFKVTPPAYIALEAGLQPVLESAGVSGLAGTTGFMRLLSIIATLGTLVCIALTARLAAGDYAGLIAGAAWGIAPLVLENGVYALPDPWVNFCCALALWLAAEALVYPKRGWWCVASVVAGLVGITLKYPAAPALLPGMLVALYIAVRERRKGLIFLGVQIALIAATGLWFLFGYKIDFSNLPREGAVVQSQGLANLFNFGRLANNLYYTIYPLNAAAWLMVVGAGILAYVLAKSARLSRIQLGVLGLALYMGVTIPWLANMFSDVFDGKIRYVLPATTAACVIFGAALVQIAQALTLVQDKLSSTQKPHPSRLRQPSPLDGEGKLSAAQRGEVNKSIRLTITIFWVALLLVILVYLPQFRQDWQLVQNRRLPDRRVELREWFDANLDPGTVIVDRDNDTTFNPIYGGIPHRNWVDWWRSENIMEHPVAEWRDDRKMSYAVRSKGEIDDMQKTAAGQAYLGEMLHLRDFYAGGMRGPQMAFFRLWRMQVETQFHFGDAITLVGYDRSAESIQPGDTLTLRFYWNTPTTPADNYSLFIHVVPEDADEAVAQADGAPSVAERPTLSWDDPSETLISAPFLLTLPADLPPGDYRVLVGLYNYTSGARLPITDADGKPLGDSLELMRLQVE